MNDTVMKSRKISLSKKFRQIWLIVVGIFLIVTALSFVKYAHYKKGQELAVATTLIGNSRLSSANYKEMVEGMYLFYNPIRLNTKINGLTIDNSASMSAASDADKALAKVLNNAGFDCYYGSDYLEYIGFIDYTVHKVKLPYIAVAALAIILLIVNLWYVADSKNEMIIEGNKIICKNGKTSKEFFVKDIKSVELASMKGLKIRGNAINYKINLLQNANELKSFIMESLSAQSEQNESAANELKQEPQPNSAAELKSYKELLDSGVITQEEFDEKKKQLLGI